MKWTRFNGFQQETLRRYHRVFHLEVRAQVDEQIWIDADQRFQNADTGILSVVVPGQTMFQRHQRRNRLYRLLGLGFPVELELPGKRKHNDKINTGGRAVGETAHGVHQAFPSPLPVAYRAQVHQPVSAPEYQQPGRQQYVIIGEHWRRYQLHRQRYYKASSAARVLCPSTTHAFNGRRDTVGMTAAAMMASSSATGTAVVT